MPQTAPEVKQQEYLEVFGAREHNLQNIDIAIPRERLVVVTGLSGSGKSSLAFDTIYAEGQRRYIETFSAYARQFLGSLERPDVDKITGLSPVISIEQKSTNRNPRSTVGTITEIYDFLRLLFARIGEARSYLSGQPMVRYNDQQIMELILQRYNGLKVLLLAPMVKGRKGHYRELFEQARKQGFLRVRIDGDITELEPNMKVDRYKVHDIELVIDFLTVGEKEERRLSSSLQTAMKHGKGVLMVIADGNTPNYYSRHLMCPETGIAYSDPEPNTFSFNSPYGACPHCKGLGTIIETDIDKIIPNRSLSIHRGGIAPLEGSQNKWIFKQLEGICQKYGCNLDTPIEELPDDAIQAILYGTNEVIRVKQESLGITQSISLNFEGIITFITNQFDETQNASIRKWAAGFMRQLPCPECNGQRLKKESLHFFLPGGYNISAMAELDLSTLRDELQALPSRLDERQRRIAGEILRELDLRLSFMMNVGLDYLTLNRQARSLSGGESQRIRLATQIGSQLTGVLYILDEPSIGLHQRDNQRLIEALKALRDIGNTVLVVEHDRDMVIAADHVIDIGPGAGINGGHIVAQGTPQQIMEQNTITADYLSGRRQIALPATRRKGSGNYLVLKGAKGNNLKNIDLRLPLGKFICITGVSGSGKSSIINETLYPILSKHFYKSEANPLPFLSIEGIEHLDKVIEIDQSPIGRTPRSNPSTYTKVFDEIRKVFAVLPEAKVRGYQPGRFSFNVKGGRCETCQGAGLRTIEMNFLPNVYVECEACQGKRYNRETLEVRYKGKSINDVLNLTINQAVDFFEHIPAIVQKIRTLKDVGLGYITLGQQSTTLSGGEAQRVKLAAELARRDTGKTFYILDEPTTGLHFEDIRVLLDVLNRLVARGNTVLVIEHNLDVIKVADHVIDLGPEGGFRGGCIISEGTPEEVAAGPGFTAQFLKDVIQENTQFAQGK
ncbi:MAG TPA: excinuclease ABC subunit UvrA [Bacteroidales bacterium]|nr:excinuclease ABC subunit UvrA [Bacteroidales bacterium]